MKLFDLKERQPKQCKDEEVHSYNLIYLPRDIYLGILNGYVTIEDILSKDVLNTELKLQMLVINNINPFKPTAPPKYNGFINHIDYNDKLYDGFLNGEIQIDKTIQKYRRRVTNSNSITPSKGESCNSLYRLILCRDILFVTPLAIDKIVTNKSNIQMLVRDIADMIGFRAMCRLQDIRTLYTTSLMMKN